MIKPKKSLKGVRTIEKSFKVKSVHCTAEINERCLINVFGKTASFYILSEFRTYDGTMGFESLQEVYAKLDIKTGTLHERVGKAKLL